MGRRAIRPDVALLGFAAAPFVFHQLPPLVGDPLADWVDLLTPFAMVGATAVVLLSLHAAPRAVALAVVGAILYVDGHGIHLSANAIGHEQVTGEAEDVRHFWDETFGHIWWHLGWFTLAAAIAYAEAIARRPRGWRPQSIAVASATVALLGFTLFTSTVEGGSWWLVLAATPLFVVWALRAPRPLLAEVATSFALATLLIGIWAAWHGGVPQFSDIGWI